MARKPKSTKTGLFYAREARHMSRTELVKRSGVSKQQLSRLENGQISMRLDHLKPFANALGYTPEQILLWGRYPGTGAPYQIKRRAARGSRSRRTARPGARPGAGTRYPRRLGRRRRVGARSAQGRQARRPSKIRGLGVSAQLRARSVAHLRLGLLVLDTNGDSMVPTLMSGDRVIIDTGHKTPSPDGLYAIRDSLRGHRGQAPAGGALATKPRVKIISDNPNHAAEEVPLNELRSSARCCAG